MPPRRSLRAWVLGPEEIPHLVEVARVARRGTASATRTATDRPPPRLVIAPDLLCTQVPDASTPKPSKAGRRYDGRLNPHHLQVDAPCSGPIVEVAEHDLLPGPCLEPALGHR